jgi:hypothetical protein
MNKLFFLCGLLLFVQNGFGQRKIIIKFEHYANGKKIVLNDSMYENDFGEKYTVSKLKYYVSNVYFFTTGKSNEDKKNYLIDASKNDSIIKYVNGKIVAITFSIGIDSALNCSGAQTGALDPLNDMFWTWNNGYVFFKLEGTSTSSKADKSRIEHHIGGYKEPYNALKEITIPVSERYFENNNIITINVDLDEYWANSRLAENPVITAPGILAKSMADRIWKMYLIDWTLPNQISTK